MSETHGKSSDENFATLIGKVQKIKPSLQSPHFGYKRKIRQEQRIASQNSRLISSAFTELLNENFAALSQGELRAMQALQVRIVREFDFHGYFVDDALQLLNDALSERRNARSEYWQIVHGKGHNSSPYDKAPLKNAIFEVLRTHSAIAAAVSVCDRDGKSGSVVVKIHSRKHRQF